MLFAIDARTVACALVGLILTAVPAAADTILTCTFTNGTAVFQNGSWQANRGGTQHA
jgi:hypothetical protein